MKSSLAIYLSGILIAAGWLVPGSTNSIFLGWAGTLLLCLFIAKTERPYRTFFRTGVIMHIIGFHWLFFTIRDFGGFGNFGALLVFAIFALGSSIQFLIFVFVWRNLPGIFHRWSLAITPAWIASEALSIRIFPWHLGHSQLAFTPFVQIADLGGAITVSAVMLLVCESMASQLTSGWHPKQLIGPLAFGASLIYGNMRIEELNALPFREQEVALVQGNVTLEEKHDIKMFRINTQRYRELTEKIVRPGVFVVWPETVITEWIFANLKSADQDPRGRVPFFQGSPLLVGSLTFETEEILHNSALAIQPDGSMDSPYHKQVLMPFGEYTPLGDIIPGLRELNSTAGDFTPGDGIKVFNYKLSADGSSSQTLKVAPLICYEDVMPRLAKEATLQGADVLVNITNDAWFGKSLAPYQHNLIASFRAIENRRYLLRATNSGMTAIIDPLGKLEGELPIFSEGVLEAKIKIRSMDSPFVKFLGDLPWLAVGALAALLAFIKRVWFGPVSRIDSLQGV